MGGDYDANYAYYALHKLHMLPHEFLQLATDEKAFVCAAIDTMVEKEKKEAAKIDKK